MNIKYEFLATWQDDKTYGTVIASNLFEAVVMIKNFYLPVTFDKLIKLEVSVM